MIFVFCVFFQNRDFSSRKEFSPLRAVHRVLKSFIFQLGDSIECVYFQYAHVYLRNGCYTNGRIFTRYGYKKCKDLFLLSYLFVSDAVWGNVTEAALKDSVDALKSYTIDMGIKRFLDDLMKLLNQTQAISQQGYEYSMKCAYRVTFLVQKIITQHDFSMIHKYIDELQNRQPKVVRFELEGLPLEKFDTIVAPGNTILKDFGLKHSCLVSLKKIGKPDGEWVVKAMIKKVVEDVSSLEDVKAKLIQQLVVKEETKVNHNPGSAVAQW